MLAGSLSPPQRAVKGGEREKTESLAPLRPNLTSNAF
jgi:hypothetical protein